jgi:hypothetical protein
MPSRKGILRAESVCRAASQAIHVAYPTISPQYWQPAAGEYDEHE